MAILSNLQKKAVQNILDNVIDEFGKSCRLVYQPKLVDCDNCVKPAISTYSNSFWRHGGPNPVFAGGICSVCNGSNKKTQEVSEIIKMTCSWELQSISKSFTNVAPGIRLPYAIMQTRGHLRDLPKINRCIELVVQLPVEPYMVGKYKLKGEASDQFNIIQDKYFIAVWERIA